MNKFFFFTLLLLTQLANAQYVRYRMDLLSGKINGKDINMQNRIIQTDISDTNDVLFIGFNSDNERLAVKFYLLRIATPEGTYYLPSMHLYFVERSGFIKEVPFKQPDFNHPLTKTNTYYKIMNQSESTVFGENKFELKYNYYIDGNNLKYDGVQDPKSKPASLQLLLKSLKLDDSLVAKDKKLVLKETPALQTKEITKYLKKPVILNYKIQSGHIGNMECVVVEAAIKYQDKKGKKDSVEFIQTMSLVKKMGIYEMLDCDDDGKNCKSEIYCDFDLVFDRKP